MSLPIEEQWRPVPGWDGKYEVSDLGRVRSLAYVQTDTWGRKRLFPGKILKGRAPDPYVRVTLSNGVGRQEDRRVHTLVLAAFVGPRPAGSLGCHNDGDFTNNKLSNLRWDTPRSNNLDTVAHGAHNNASKTTCNRGHLLVQPNLIQSDPNRCCLSCRTGRDYARRAGRENTETTIQAAADAKYAELFRPEPVAA